MTLEYTNALINAGLENDQAVVYEALLRGGEQQASKVAKEVPLSRPLVYKILEELIELDLAEKKHAEGSIATFSPKHPVGIVKAIDARKAEIERTKESFEAISGSLASLFNLSSGKPGVQFFEGENGVWEVLMDSLTATEEILAYSDLDAIARYIPELNTKYAALRESRKVKKRALVIDSPETRKFLRSYDPTFTTQKLITSQGETPAFQTTMQIYNSKVSYITLTETYLVGVIITDPNIASTHRYLFESLWTLSGGEVL